MFYIVCTVLGKVFGVIADGHDGIGWNANISFGLLRLPMQFNGGYHKPSVTQLAPPVRRSLAKVDIKSAKRKDHLIL